jgi:hypothetical protein
MKRLLAVFVVALLSSCGVGFSFSGASIPADAKSISVQYFQNHSALASSTTSQVFTDALRDYVTSQSHLPLVQNGDLDFSGAISGYTIQPVAAAAGTVAQSSLTRLTISVDVTFADKNDPKKNFSASFARYADFPSGQNISSVQNDLITQINKQLVQDIFDKAFNNW